MYYILLSIVLYYYSEIVKSEINNAIDSTMFAGTNDV